MEKRIGKAVLIGVAVSLLTVIGVRTTLAYLTQRESVTNVFTVGELKIGLKEPEWEPKEGDGVEMRPGYSVYKNPTVKNLNTDQAKSAPAYVRMKILIKDQDGAVIADARALELMGKMIRYDASHTGTYDTKGTAEKIIEGRIPGYSEKEIEELPMVNPLFARDEARSAEGVLVYNYLGSDGSGILRDGEWATLFNVLAVPTEWTKTEIDAIGDFRLEIRAEAIQAAGFADQEEALRALDHA